jgi:hypothetical protein
VKTLLFCTAYAESQKEWNDRYKTWYDYYKASDIKHDKIMMFDDCSPCRPEFLPEENFYTFSTHLGRKAICDYEGWHRSFYTAVIYAQNNGFDKIIHSESDSFFLSKKIIEFVNNIDSGWHSMWCARHGFPESCLQIICPDKIQDAMSFFERPYEMFKGNAIEGLIPYTPHTEFMGDRYCEYTDVIPKDADFCSDTRAYMIENYFKD